MLHTFRRLLILYNINFSEKFFREYHQSVKVWIKSRPDLSLCLIWDQAICKGYHQTTLVGKELTPCLPVITFMSSAMGGSRGGGQGVRTPPPWKITKIWGFFAILVQIPWKITKLPSQHSMLDQHPAASQTPFHWRFAGGPFIVVFGSSTPIS